MTLGLSCSPHPIPAATSNKSKEKQLHICVCIYIYIYHKLYFSPLSIRQLQCHPLSFHNEHFIPLLVSCQINGNFLFCFEKFVTTHMLMTLTPSNNKHIACTNTFWHAKFEGPSFCLGCVILEGIEVTNEWVQTHFV